MKRPKTYSDELRDQRVVKLLLPLPLIRQMDHLLLDGVGGFSTRNEFVREAIESYILELTHEPAPAEPAEMRQRRLQLRPVADVPEEDGQGDFSQERPALAVADTALSVLPSEGPTIDGEARVAQEPLFGMHNRDYPSLWAARRLAAYLEDGAIAFEEFAERATEEAWTYAAELQALELELGTKLTALFPTNVDKRGAASGAFRGFAIGSVSADETGLRADGPLFLWRIIGVQPRDESVVVGLRREGRDLLAHLGGLTVAQPHPPEMARAFLAHLREHAPPDYWGFEHVLQTVAERPTRAELVGAFQQARPDWRESVAATNAQGYVARAREWGLIAPKVVEGRYELTDFGLEVQRGGGA
jgi:hypothetical protein